MNDPIKKFFPYQLARGSWIAGVIAIGLVQLTAGIKGRAIGEMFAFVFVGGGILAGIVSLASIPKFGRKDILWPALVGIAINGLLLSIAVPNFLHARQRTIEQAKQGEKQTDNWKQYQAAGVEFISPVELTNVDAFAVFKRGRTYQQLSLEQQVFAENAAKGAEAYSGQVGYLALSLNRRKLMPDESVTVDDVIARTTQAIQQQFPQGFNSGTHDVIIDGTVGTQLTIQCLMHGQATKVETEVILKQSYLWQIQVFGPADMPQYSETVEKFFGSIRFLTNDFKSAP